MKRIVICADGTWNRPEKDLQKDRPTNVLKIARAISPVGSDGVEQVVFYDWGLGSYHDNVAAGVTGSGIEKNIADGYRFLVQNYNPGDEIYLFGFSRGAYTVRSLAGLLNNCGILKRNKARLIQQAFDFYKDPAIHPDDAESVAYRNKNSVKHEVRVRFIGVWDTVGAMGIPSRMFGFLNEKHLFHDNKIGPNIDFARHALAIDEKRDDFRPTIWKSRRGLDLKQVWFAGVHSDVGGGYQADPGGAVLSDVSLQWMLDEVGAVGLHLEPHVKPKPQKNDACATANEEYEGFFRVLGKYERPIPKNMRIHQSVKQRWDSDQGYRPPKLKKRIGQYGWGALAGQD